MEKYLIILEKTETGFSAFSPDVPGCFTVGHSVENTVENFREALDLYLEEATEKGDELPQGKGLEYYINKGLFNTDEIAEEYFLAFISFNLQQVA